MSRPIKKAIVTTTINKPTEALLKFLEIAKRDDWVLVIVGDKKTPQPPYEPLLSDNLVYLDCDFQESMSKELSDLIGWNCIQRRNFGFIWAYQQGAEIIATVDDDNIPLENWGQNVVGQEVMVDVYPYKTDTNAAMPVFDPLAPTSQGPNIWHRGFPIQLLKGRTRLDKPIKQRRKVLVQADLWNGDPDIDAVYRIAKSPIVKFDRVKRLYAGEKPGPFNSQNTFLHRDVIPYYFMWPHIGRMDDIWAAYYLQTRFPDSVAYGPPSVYQKRNEHNLVKDLEAELLGYNHTLDFVKFCFGGQPKGIFPDFLPKDAIRSYDIYRGLLSA